MLPLKVFHCLVKFGHHIVDSTCFLCMRTHVQTVNSMRIYLVLIAI